MKRKISLGLSKLLSIYVSFAIVLSLFSSLAGIYVYAAEYVAAESYAAGTGTDTDPYQIATAEQLIKMIKEHGKDSNGNAAYFILTADIDLNPTNDWDPENNGGSYINWVDTYNVTSAPFVGILDGNNHKISHLYSYSTDWSKPASLIGFFENNAVIKNITLEDFYVKGIQCAGFMGYGKNIVDGSAAMNFSDVTAKRGILINSCESNNTGGVGGIIANANGVSFKAENCFAIELKISISNSSTRAGAISGLSHTSSGTVVSLNNCSALGCEGVTELLGAAKGNGNNGTVLTYNVNTDYESGIGTKIDPYVITNVHQLYRMVIEGGQLDNGTSAYYILNNDIQINDTTDWSPDTGNNKKYKLWNVTTAKDFAGDFNGNGYKISGLYINQTTGNGGFIAKTATGAKVTNVNFENSFVKAKGWLGTVVGYAQKAIDISYVTVRNATFSGGYGSGAVVGLCDGTLSLTNCSVVNTNALGAFTCSQKSNGQKQNYKGCWTTECSNATDFYYACKDAKNVTKDSSYFVTDSSTIKGASAKNAMPELDWHNAWKVGSKNEYPSLREIVWNGKTTSEPVLRDENASNSEENPYEIYSPSELYWLACNYKTADGWYELCMDIYLNETESTEDTQWYELSDLNKWFTDSSDSVKAEGFKGHLNGNYYSVYGLYIDSGSDVSGGLFPSLSNGAEIKNLLVSKAYLNAQSGNLGGIAGYVTENSQIKIESCSFDEAVNINANGAGGFIAKANTGSVLNLKNCSFTGTASKAAMVSELVGDAKANIALSFTNNEKLVNEGNVTFENCYQTGEASANGLTKIEDSSMRGTKAKYAGMINLDYDYIWLPVVDEYPVLRNPRMLYGTAGEVWSGKAADDYAINTQSGARGDGTKINPYIIETGEQLYRMMTVRENGAYYELACDIYLNDVSNAQWYSGSDVNTWVDADITQEAKKGGWRLHLEGNGYSIYGLYCKTTAYRATGLIPVMGNGTTVSNVHIRNSYYTAPAKNGENDARTYVGGIGAYVIPDSSVTVGGCTVDSTVIFAQGDSVGGIIGGNAGSSVLIECCGFAGVIESTGRFAGGIYGNTWKPLKLNYCYSIGTVVGDKDDNTHAKATFAYGTKNQEESYNSTKLNVIQLEADKFYPENAKEYLNFDWENWKFVSGYDYPFPTYDLNVIDGVVGGIWSGNTANNYQPYTKDYSYPEGRGLKVSEIDGTIIDPISGDYYYGDGTDEYPYHIATGEQFVKMIKENCTKDVAYGLDPVRNSFLMIEDIYLNDISDPNWTSEDNASAHNWLEGNYAIGFRGHFNGDGHIVFGLRFVGNKDYVITGLFPVVGEGAVVEKVGVVNAYLNNASTKSTYCGGVVGYIQQFGSYIGVDSHLSRDEMTVNGLTEPLIKECFVTDSYICTKSAGGIVCGAPAPVTVEDCYFTGTIGEESVTCGGIVGNDWVAGNGVRIKSSYCITTDYGKGIGGATALGSSVQGGYVYTKEKLYNFKLKHPMNMYGEEAYEHLPEFFADGKISWRIVENGTPVLSAFGDRAVQYTYNTPIYTTVSFTTNVKDLVYPSITGVFGDPITIPVPEREGYEFAGWYYYSNFQCEAELTAIPRNSVNLFAKWNKICVTQDFEMYPDTSYDRNPDGDYEYYRIGLINYDSKYVHGGAKVMHRIGNTANEEDFLLNYEEELQPGTKYEMTFWATTDTDGTAATVSLVHNSWPDIDLENEPSKGIEEVVKLSDMKDGEWKQYTYTFTAQTNWVSIRTTGNASLYFDDFILLPVGKGEIIGSAENTDKDTDKEISSKTGDESISIIALLSVFVVSFVVKLATKKQMKANKT